MEGSWPGVMILPKRGDKTPGVSSPDSTSAVSCQYPLSKPVLVLPVFSPVQSIPKEKGKAI